MPSYPSSIVSPRTKANAAGVTYDPTKTTVIFAEDVQLDDAEIVAIETELGTNPKGGSVSVAARFSAIEGSIPTVPVKATGAELNTGTDDAKFATAKAIKDSDVAFLTDIPAVPARIVQVKVYDDATAATTGDGKAIFCVPLLLNGLNLVGIAAFVTTVSSSGLPTVQIRNVTDSVDMLSTKVSIDQGATTSYTATTPAVIDGSHDDVATGDLISIDIDTAGTGAKGLGIILTFA